MRFTAASPQICAMSVAFDDHGEMVPGRGATILEQALDLGARASRTLGEECSTTVRSAALRSEVNSATCTNSALSFRAGSPARQGLEQFLEAEIREGR